MVSSARMWLYANFKTYLKKYARMYTHIVADFVILVYLFFFMNLFFDLPILTVHKVVRIPNFESKFWGGNVDVKNEKDNRYWSGQVPYFQTNRFLQKTH